MIYRTYRFAGATRCELDPCQRPATHGIETVRHHAEQRETVVRFSRWCQFCVRVAAQGLRVEGYREITAEAVKPVAEQMRLA